MKIGILGSGIVAKTLGSGFVGNGHEVMLASREAAKLAGWAAENGDHSFAGSFEETARFGEILILSVNAANVESAITHAGLDNFSDKIVIDVTNAMDFSQGLPPRFTVGYGNSLGEQHQAMLPDSYVVKAFNTMGANVMTNADFNGEAASHFIAGNSDAAKAKVTTLLEEFGWDVLDVGAIEQSFFLEALASLWVNYSIRTGEREQAFKMLVR